MITAKQYSRIEVRVAITHAKVSDFYVKVSMFTALFPVADSMTVPHSLFVYLSL